MFVLTWDAFVKDLGIVGVGNPDKNTLLDRIRDQYFVRDGREEQRGVFRDDWKLCGRWIVHDSSPRVRYISEVRLGRAALPAKYLSEHQRLMISAILHGDLA